MQQHIEDTLRPETTNEVLLIDRIRQLQRQLYTASPLSPHDPNDLELTLPAPSPVLSLPLGARFEAGLDTGNWGWRVAARTHGPTRFGYSVYISEAQRIGLDRHQEGRLFDDVWRKGMHSLAKELRRMDGEKAR